MLFSVVVVVDEEHKTPIERSVTHVAQDKQRISRDGDFGCPGIARGSPRFDLAHGTQIESNEE